MNTLKDPYVKNISEESELLRILNIARGYQSHQFYYGDFGTGVEAVVDALSYGELYPHRANDEMEEHRCYLGQGVIENKEFTNINDAVALYQWHRDINLEEVKKVIVENSTELAKIAFNENKQKTYVAALKKAL